MTKSLMINLEPKYTIYFVSALFHEALLAEICQSRNERLVIVTDSHLVNNYAAQLANYFKQHQLECEVLFFPAGETFKTRVTKSTLEDQLLEKAYGRDTCLIAIGGGVVSDMAGFIAATYCRGISSIYIPTTFLAMVDASIGGKTGVNTAYGKNLIGAFYQPKTVFIDTTFLETLPIDEYKNGIVETIKHALIADANLFDLLCDSYQSLLSKQASLLNEIVFRSCDIKRQIVEQDEKDYGIRHLLNFGHTIGHVIETIEEYRLSHGEAVAIGMAVESYLSKLMGYLSQQDFDKIMAVLALYQLPLKTDAFTNLKNFKAALTLDKKAKAKIPRIVLLDAIGKPHVEQQSYSLAVPESVLDEALAWAQQLMGE